MTVPTTPSHLNELVNGSLGGAKSAPAGGETMTLCGAKTTKVECHEETGHHGMHCGLLAVSGGRFADIFWTDDWHVDTALPWVIELPVEAEVPVFPVVVYSRCASMSDWKDWTNT